MLKTIEDVLGSIKNRKKSLVTVDLAASLEEVAEIMAREKVNLVIVKGNNEYLGIISTSDTSRESSSEKRPSERHAFEIMTARKDVITTSIAGNLNTVSKTMTEKEIRHIIVKNEDDKWIAVLSIKDILRAITQNETELEENLKMYAESGWPPVS